MKKKTIVITASLITAVCVGSIIVYGLMAGYRDEQAGKDKFSQAITQLRQAEPQLDNPCLGASVLRAHSYGELSKKSIDDIKELAKTDPGSC